MFSLFQFYWKSTSEDNPVPENCHTSFSRLANTVLVCSSDINAICSSIANNSSEENTDSTTQCLQSSPTLPQTPVNWLSCVRETLQSQGITGEALNIIIDSWRVSTQKQYKTSVSAWLEYCKKQRIRIIAPSLPQLLDFLTIQSHKVWIQCFGNHQECPLFIYHHRRLQGREHPLISRFMSGFFNRKPTFPRYAEIWDSQIVLNNLKGYPDIKDMTLKQLTLKMTMIMALVTAQRTQTIKLLSIEGMQVKPGEYSFQINSLLKQTSASGGRQRHLQPVIFKKYDHDQVLVFFLC